MRFLGAIIRLIEHQNSQEFGQQNHVRTLTLFQHDLGLGHADRAQNERCCGAQECHSLHHVVSCWLVWARKPRPNGGTP